MINKFECIPCKYTTHNKNTYNKHLESAKHLRGGMHIIYNCEKCEYIGTTRWNLKMHIATKHMTLKEKKELKFYCELCDCLCFTQLYYKSHIKGQVHQDNLIAKDNPNAKIKTLKMHKHNEPIQELKVYITELLYTIKNELINELKFKDTC